MKNWTSLLGCSLIGICVGWLIGLSMSPVLQSVLGALLALVVTIVAAGAGIKSDQSPQIPKINPWPMAVLMLGIAIAAPVGILAREWRWFAPARAAAGTVSTPDTGAGLYDTVSPEACDAIRHVSPE